MLLLGVSLTLCLVEPYESKKEREREAENDADKKEITMEEKL